MHTSVVIDRESMIVRLEIAEKNRPAPASADDSTTGETAKTGETEGADKSDEEPAGEKLPTRFRGTVMLSSERPARDMHQVVEAIIEQLTNPWLIRRIEA